MTVNQLMDWALMKYKALKTKEIKDAPNPEDEKMIALEAKVGDSQKKLTAKKREPPNIDNETPPKKTKGLQNFGPNPKETLFWLLQKPSDEILHKP